MRRLRRDMPQPSGSHSHAAGSSGAEAWRPRPAQLPLRRYLGQRRSCSWAQTEPIITPHSTQLTRELDRATGISAKLLPELFFAFPHDFIQDYPRNEACTTPSSSANQWHMVARKGQASHGCCMCMLQPSAVPLHFFLLGPGGEACKPHYRHHGSRPKLHGTW